MVTMVIYGGDVCQWKTVMANGSNGFGAITSCDGCGQWPPSS